MNGALTGVRVIDLSTRLSGAWAARLFGDFGADVVLVEDDDGHPLRAEPPFLANRDGQETSLLYSYVCWNKRSITRATADLDALIETADVLITTELEHPEEVQSLGSDAIHLSITPHGLRGPLANIPGNNLTACATVGWSEINRCTGDPPLQLPHNQCGYIAGVAGFVGGAAALMRCQRTGHGDTVDVSEAEALASTCAPWAKVGLFVGGNRMWRGPNGARARDRAGPLWQTKNGPINFGYGDWQQWSSALHFLGLPEIADDPQFVSAFGRHQKDTRPVRDGLANSVAERDKWEIFHGLAERRCISGVVQNARELAESEHLNERNFIVSTKVDGTTVAAAGAPAHLSETPWHLGRHAPGRGEHDEDDFSRSRTKRSAAGDRTLPLRGIRVLTFTQAWSGTFGTQLLALLGADVVQIESRKRPDVWRGAGAPVPPAIRNPDVKQDPLNNNGMYNTVNHNKRGITLDLSQPRGREIFWELIPRFDILADNFSPHVMTNWGVTLETLREHRPDIIFASLSGYGRTGPLAEYPANGATTEPMAGVASIHGYEGDNAQNTGGLIPDPISGFYFAGAILAALLHREKTGEGQRIDLSMIESVAVQLGDAIMDFSANGVVRRPGGNRHPRLAPHNVYETKDEQWIAIAVEDDAMFQRLANEIGIDDGKFASMTGRKSNENELDEIVQNWTRQRSAHIVLKSLEKCQVCFAPVRGFQEIYDDPSEQFIARGFMVPVTHPEAGTHYMPTNPWTFASTADGHVNPSPCFGQHSCEVLAEELGIGEAEYDELVEQGITGTTRI